MSFIPRWAVRYKKSVITAGLGTSLYLYDKNFNAEAWVRTLRSIRVLSLIAIDYKLNFVSPTTEELAGNFNKAMWMKQEDLHSRNANRFFNLLETNKGLYIKAGQAMALQSQNFPKAFRARFETLYDHAPQDSQAEVQDTLFAEYQCDPKEIFDEFDYNNCLASASIAQVYKAKLKTGEPVAVKVQHAGIKKQVKADLWVYRTYMRIYGWAFDMPLKTISEYIASSMQEETDFRSELRNAEMARNYVDQDPELKNKVYVPKNYVEYSKERVMVSEWIDGIPLQQKEKIAKEGFNINKMIYTLISYFSKQYFEYGHVHCDPHPGNILVRKFEGKDQLVLIDHGLYAHQTDEFRLQNSLFWKSLFILDHKTVEEVVHSWGIAQVDLFATITQLRRYRTKPVDPASATISEAEFQSKLVNTFRTMIADVSRMPLVLILLGRCNSLLQGCNRYYGSPVNRVKIMAVQASRSYSKLKHQKESSWVVRHWKSFWESVRFGVAVWVLDSVFIAVKIRQWFASKDKKEEYGLEAIIEKQFLTS